MVANLHVYIPPCVVDYKPMKFHHTANDMSVTILIYLSLHQPGMHMRALIAMYKHIHIATIIYSYTPIADMITVLHRGYI